MKPIIDWLASGDPPHWQAMAWTLVILAPGILLSIANAVTKHYSEKKGLVKFLYFVADLFSVLASKGSPTTLKLPGVPSPYPVEPPKRDEDKTDPPTFPPGGGLALVAVLLTVALSGCATFLQRSAQTVITAGEGEKRAEEVYVEHVRRTEDQISTAAEERKDPDGGRAALATFRKSHRPVAKSLNGLRVALYAATEGLLLTRAGKLPERDLQKLIDNVLDAAKEVASQLAAIGALGSGGAK